MRAGYLLLLLSGCDLVFGTSSVHPADAPQDDAPPDDDGDVIPPDGVVTSDALACPTGYMATTQGTFRPVLANATFADAETDCADDMPGITHLAVPTTQNQLNVIHLLDNTFNLWVGVTDVQTEGTFRSITMPEIDYPKPGFWAASDPDGGNNVDCVAVQANGVKGVLQDDACTLAHHYVCACDGITVDPATLPPINAIR